MIRAEGDLQVLRKAQARIEEAELRDGPSAARTRGRLTEGIKQRHRAPVAAQEQLLAAVVAVGVSDPDIRRGTTEESDAAPQERVPLSPKIVVETHPRRPEQMTARQSSGVPPQRRLERTVRDRGVRQHGHFATQAGGHGQAAHRAPAVLRVESDLESPEGGSTRT